MVGRAFVFVVAVHIAGVVLNQGGHIEFHVIHRETEQVRFALEVVVFDLHFGFVPAVEEIYKPLKRVTQQPNREARLVVAASLKIQVPLEHAVFYEQALQKVGECKISPVKMTVTQYHRPLVLQHNTLHVVELAMFQGDGTWTVDIISCEFLQFQPAYYMVVPK